MKFNKNAKIFVAGHRGMVGSAIVKKLKEAGYNNIVTARKNECDLTNQRQVNEFFALEKPEFVFLAAAKVGGIMANKTYKADFIYDNIMIASNVIHASYQNNVKKLLNLGSSCIYPKFAEQPIKEEYLLTGELEPTNQPYALAKIAAIELCKSYNFQHGTNFLSLMPTNLFGSGDNYNLETSHVLPAILRKMFLSKWLMEANYDKIAADIAKYPLGFDLEKSHNLKDKHELKEALSKIGVTETSLTLWGSGKVLREFLHTDDLAISAIYFMEEHNYESMGDFVNIGTGKDISIRELAETIQRAVGYEGKLLFDTSKPDGTPRKLLDVSKAKSLGWQYSIELEYGIENLVLEY